ncbi:MAG: alcohol dehydrogenase catalytic domain-containing protein [Nitriliruptorales bacterium]|nr:alcohol dehydrogenase catalytic domain-containing protein [Nitriliruptorales bacterium]
MRAVTWQGRRKVSVETVPDPTIQEPTDAIVRITTTGLCGSDLHLYEVMGPFLDAGDILGHEPMGVVEAVGSAVTELKPGDRVVVPFQIACGSCFMCDRRLYSQCETTQTREQGMGANLFGYTKLYGQVPGGQAEYLRVPQANFTHIKVPDGPPDERFVYLSDVLPTAWQAVEYADIEDGGTVAILGLGPIGEMAARIAANRGHRVVGIDVEADRLKRSGAWDGVETYEYSAEIGDQVRDLTGGRGPDVVIDAVGMEAHGSPVAKALHQMTSFLPDPLAAAMFKTAGVDRLAALKAAVDMVRRGGTISLIGVYGGEADPLPLMTMFDKQVQLRMGQANVKAWSDDILPLVLHDADPLGVESFHTHSVPLEQAPAAYDMFQKKEDGAIKVVFKS